MNMSPDERTRRLARLQSELVIDRQRFAVLERNFAVAVAEARACCRRQGVPAGWAVRWLGHWDDLAHYVQRIQSLLRQLEQYTRPCSTGLLHAAMESWEKLQADDVRLTVSLSAIRMLAASQDAAVRGALQHFEAQLTGIQTIALVLRIRIELLRGSSREGVDSLVAHLLGEHCGQSVMAEPELLRQ